MHVRNSAKAIVLHEGKLLVNRCSSCFGHYYALPGGGQRFGELLPDALKRELLEETGYSVKPLRLCGIYERLNANRTDANSHKIYFIFLCKLGTGRRRIPSERDRYQIGYEWIDLQDLPNKNLFPRAIRDHIPDMINAQNAIFIGSEHGS